VGVSCSYSKPQSLPKYLSVMRCRVCHRQQRGVCQNSSVWNALLLQTFYTDPSHWRKITGCLQKHLSYECDTCQSVGNYICHQSSRASKWYVDPRKGSIVIPDEHFHDWTQSDKLHTTTGNRQMYSVYVFTASCG